MTQKIIKTEDGSVIIAQSEYDNTHDDYKGVWTTERWDMPDWEKVRHLHMGKRTWMPPFALFGRTCLLIESQHFKIISDKDFDDLINSQKYEIWKQK